ncbi:Fpg/Nei family DNA glycosylase [Streptomyces benahoarensis]|uniref:Endonuclease 8 1 n=1 Tax=Streptomyces benahoarensis TaxID=2595054 RepID=A0A553ZPT0_9ACTN|nr:DNA-formamidopyrimidine glycosylase family protein [Streptomyces benahoarensis]TSB30458.1 Fpg/Nei family DNA glycosylase [Streptomyces benahoarensis]TSB43479.1 Fpg/Nei family DNA glycosylase [Streptomyces benahoarensis]
MPEGHTIHRLALDHRERFAGETVRASSPQGRFAAGAALVDGRVLERAEAHGKHLFLGFGPAGWIHIHLGLFGKLGFGTAPSSGDLRHTPVQAGFPAPAADTVRLRLATGEHHADLRGPTVCALITDAEKQAVHDRLGPDPLRPEDDGERAWRRISRSRTTVAALLLDQKIVAGVGNVYRAEVLFRRGIDPYLPGRALARDDWDAIWADLVALMREGVRHNRIDTVRPEHMPEAMGRPPRVDDHGGEVYVYRRAHQPCHLCATEIRTADLAARNLFWCPRCQPTNGG